LFRQGVVTIRSAFQAKRWRNNRVSRPEIDKFRGAISLLLLDGEPIAESMIRNGIGVVRRPVQLFDIDPEFFDFPASDVLQ